MRLRHGHMIWQTHKLRARMWLSQGCFGKFYLSLHLSLPHPKLLEQVAYRWTLTKGKWGTWGRVEKSDFVCAAASPTTIFSTTSFLSTPKASSLCWRRTQVLISTTTCLSWEIFNIINRSWGGRRFSAHVQNGARAAHTTTRGRLMDFNL